MVADGAYMGHIVIADTLKGDAKQTISKLKSMAVKAVMLTGDKADVAANVAEKLGIEQYYAELLPQDKAKQVESLKQTLGEKDSLAFVGDGINDAPVLALADVVGSTAVILKYCVESDKKEFIIATEAGILHEIERQCEGKTFYPVPPEISEGSVGCSCNECNYMKLNSLEKIYNTLKYEWPTVDVPEEIRVEAVKPIERMLELS
jgi:quinolinate synthase